MLSSPGTLMPGGHTHVCQFCITRASKFVYDIRAQNLWSSRFQWKIFIYLERFVVRSYFLAKLYFYQLCNGLQELL